SAVALLSVGAVRANPAKNAYDAFYKFLDEHRLALTNPDEGLGPAFMTAVIEPVCQIKAVGSMLVGLLDDYALTTFIIAQLFYRTFILKPTNNVGETERMDAVFVAEYKTAFKTPSKTVLPMFKTQLARFPEYLKLQCFQGEIDNAQLAENVDPAMRLSYIINDATRAIHTLLRRIFHARCDGQYGRSSKDVSFMPTNMDNLLHWLARYCEEKRGARMGIKGTNKPKYDESVAPEAGTEAEIIAYLRRDDKKVKTKYEKERRRKEKGKGIATAAEAPPTASSSSTSGSKRKADEVDPDDAGDEASGDQAASQSGSKHPSKRRAKTTITCKGSTFKVDKELADLLMSIQQEKVVTFREVDG
ncbi:hypothetical protein HDU80_003197, partial [Chytriomyces hyalinus]